MKMLKLIRYFVTGVIIGSILYSCKEEGEGDCYRPSYRLSIANETEDTIQIDWYKTLYGVMNKYSVTLMPLSDTVICEDDSRRSDFDVDSAIIHHSSHEIILKSWRILWDGGFLQDPERISCQELQASYTLRDTSLTYLADRMMELYGVDIWHK